LHAVGRGFESLHLHDAWYPNFGAARREVLPVGTVFSIDNVRIELIGGNDAGPERTGTLAVRCRS
jgi:hypothetical protein